MTDDDAGTRAREAADAAWRTESRRVLATLIRLLGDVNWWAPGPLARLYRRLVHELEIAQDVEAEQESGLLGSAFGLSVTARAGVSLSRIRDEVGKILHDMTMEVSEHEVQRARHHIETATIDAVQSVGGFGGKADRLNHYFFYAGDPGYLAQDLERYAQLTPDTVRDFFRVTCAAPNVTLSVVPRGQSGLAAGA